MPITTNFEDLIAGYSRRCRTADIRSRGRTRRLIVLARGAWTYRGNSTVRVWAVRS